MVLYDWLLLVEFAWDRWCSPAALRQRALWEICAAGLGSGHAFVAGLAVMERAARCRLLFPDCAGGTGPVTFIFLLLWNCTTCGAPLSILSSCGTGGGPSPWS